MVLLFCWQYNVQPPEAKTEIKNMYFVQPLQDVDIILLFSVGCRRYIANTLTTEMGAYGIPNATMITSFQEHKGMKTGGPSLQMEGPQTFQSKANLSIAAKDI